MAEKVDIKVIQDQNGFFDLSIENGDLSTVDNFDSAIYVSLFTDARASASQVAIPQKRRGWIGNTASIVSGRDLGGHLWLIEQRRLTQRTLNEAVDYARQSLSWMIEDNIANSVDVEGQIDRDSGIILKITITGRDGSIVSQYVPLWRNTANAN